MNLSVFHGFSQQAACEIAGATPAVLKSLADKSLLRVTSSARYEMHELLRRYAAEKLAATPTAHETHNRHCTYYAAFLQRQEAVLAGTDAVQAMAAIKAEFGNVHAAWRWAVAHVRLEEIEQSVNSLSRFYVLAGPFQEAATLFGMAVAALSADALPVAALSIAREEARNGIRAYEAEALSADALSIARHGMQAPLILSRLLVEEARFLNKRGMYEQAAKAAEAAVGLAQANQAAGPEAAGRVQWGAALWNLGNYAGARSQLEQALVLAQVAQSHPVEADSLYNLGFVCWHLGDYAAAGGHLERALHIYHESGDRQGESASLSQLGTIAQVRHDYASARAYYEQALRLCREIGERHCEGITLSNLGLACTQQGDYAEAGAFYEQALQISRELGSRRTEGVVLINLGYTFDQQGDYTRARAYYEQSLRIYREIGDQQSESLALACLGLLAHHRGDDETARECCRQALDIARDIGNRRVEGYALTRLGHALAGLGRLAEAAQTYQQALALQRKLGQVNLAMEPSAGLARVSLAQGDLAQARTYVAEILAHLETHTLDGADEPLRVYLTCYRVLSAAGDPGAQAVLATAHRLLQERAARIENEELRRSFLERVIVHREIAENVKRKT